MKSAGKELKTNAYLFDTDDSPVTRRFQTCLEWYIRKACFYKRLYYILMSAIGICPLVVAALSGLSSSGYAQVQIVVIVLSLVASVSAFLVNMLRAQEKWTEYRVSAEYLKRERSRFLNEVLRDGANAEKIQSDFLQKIEAYMADENREWEERIRNGKAVEDT